MRANFAAIAAAFVFVLASPVQAQVTLDAAKVTCDQFVRAKISDPKMTAAWLSGFYNGKRNKTVIDKQTFEANLTKLVNFCNDGKNGQVPVMQAIDRAIESAKP